MIDQQRQVTRRKLGQALNGFIAICLIHSALILLSRAEKVNPTRTTELFWKAFRQLECRPRIEELLQVIKRQDASIGQIGDIANGAILNPNTGEDRHALKMILEVAARGRE